MVRGLCPRNRIRWDVDRDGCTVVNTGAIGHAERVRLTRPGGHTTAGRRGCRPYGRLRNVGISIVGSRCERAKTSTHPLGSPERGAVTALRAVTEGLIPALVRRNHVARKPTQPTVGAGFHARPAWVYGQRRHARTNGARAVPAGLHTWGDGRKRERRGKRGCGWSRWTDASNAARRSHNRRASRTPPLTGGCET